MIFKTINSPHLNEMITQFINPESLLYGVFLITISVFLLIDLGVFNRNPKPITTKSALYQSIFWVSVSLIFGFLILKYDPTPLQKVVCRLRARPVR